MDVLVKAFRRFAKTLLSVFILYLGLFFFIVSLK